MRMSGCMPTISFCLLQIIDISYLSSPFEEKIEVFLLCGV